MIGHLSFYVGRQHYTATLTDDLHWSCSDAEVQQELSETFPVEPSDDVPNIVIGRHLLYQTASRLGGKVSVPSRRRGYAAQPA